MRGEDQVLEDEVGDVDGLLHQDSVGSQSS